MPEELIKQAFDEEFEEQLLAIRQSMSYYRCALMEVETKFKVLNEQFSLYYDRNPIESISTELNQKQVSCESSKTVIFHYLWNLWKKTFLILPVSGSLVLF